MSLNGHVINHTHWDREWFITSEYTRLWIPELIFKVAEITKQNPQYLFLLDGVTIILEDLKEISSESYQLAIQLIRSGNLIVGPYYVQPDWKLTSGEMLMRNIELGLSDVSDLEAQPPKNGWMVDIFGHISQSPQIHSAHGLDGAYVWRGVPDLEPFFTWVGADGTDMKTINLFSGYRNLYGVA